MKINNIFNKKFDVKTLNIILRMLNARQLKIKTKTITIKELLLLLVQEHRQHYLKMKVSKKGGDSPDCYFKMQQTNNIQDYLNTSSLNFDNSFPPPPMTYYRDFI